MTEIDMNVGAILSAVVTPDGSAQAQQAEVTDAQVEQATAVDASGCADVTSSDSEDADDGIDFFGSANSKQINKECRSLSQSLIDVCKVHSQQRRQPVHRLS